MRRSAWIAAAAFSFSLAALVVAAQELDKAQLAATVHHSNVMEMEMARLAQEKGHSPRVRRYGALLQRDHRMADRRLLAAARREQLPIEPPPVDHAHQQIMERLRTASGEEFDRIFLQAMEQRHQELIATLEAARPEQERRVQRLMARLIPVLRQHERLAAELRGEG